MTKNQEDKEVLFLFPPDPLHVNLLGPVNDVLDLLEEMYPCEMKEEYYLKHCLNKTGEMPGGKFNGPSIKHILLEDMLIDLENILPTSEIAQDFTNHLRDIRELHKMCVAKELQ